MNCEFCGKEISKDFLLCPYCGKKLRVHDRKNIELRPKDKTELTLAGHTLYFDSKLIAYNDLRKRFIKKAIEIEAEYTDWYKELPPTYEQLFSSAVPEIYYQSIKANKFGVSVLMEYGIDDIDENTLSDLVSERKSLSELLDPLRRLVEEIEDCAEEMEEKRRYEKNSRSQWVGGGFGISGAIKGAFAAGVLNFGTNALRNIGDAISTSCDNSEITKMREDLAKNLSETPCLPNVVYNYTFNVFKAVYQILVETNLIKKCFSIIKKYWLK